MRRIYFDDIFANNFGELGNNSTKFSDILDISKIHFPTKIKSPIAYITWQVFAFKQVFKKKG